MTSPDEERRRNREFLRQIGERAGIPLEEMERRYEEFMSKVPVSSLQPEELEKRKQAFISQFEQKRGQVGKKISLTLTRSEVAYIENMRKRLGTQSIPETIRAIMFKQKKMAADEWVEEKVEQLKDMLASKVMTECVEGKLSPSEVMSRLREIAMLK